MHLRKKKRLACLLLFSLFFSYAGYSQTFSLSLKKASLEKAFREIELQTPLRFVYTREMMEQSHPVTVTVANTSLQKVLDLIFESQPLDFLVDDRFIKVRVKALPVATPVKSTDVQGKITDAGGQPLADVSVNIKGSRQTTVTDNTGSFILHGVADKDKLLITSVGYGAKEIPVNGQTFLDITLQVAVSELDEAVVMAYGTTTRRLNTGNISKVSADEIGKQPVANPLAALQGRVPGLVVTQANGYAGSPFSVQIRGQNSLLQGSEPFFVIDGVPFAQSNAGINQIDAATVISPLYTLNPADIESIEILKDADATAIYGSRGANGVILITTKKGKAGKTKFDFTIYTGAGRVTKTMNLLNTQQYVAMRREAQLNDGIAPTALNSADILVWDSTRYTDFKKLFIGGTARTTDMQLSISGGGDNTSFRIGGSYHRETTVLPTGLADQRGSMNFNLNHLSPNKKLGVSLKSIYSLVDNNLPYRDLASVVNVPPNLKLYDQNGKLNWEEGGISFKSLNISGADANPLAILETKYKGQFQNFSNNLQLSYVLFPGLSAKTSLGYDIILSDERRLHPSTSLDPFDTQLAHASFANRSQKSWIIEPTIEYEKKFKTGKFTTLMGATWQANSGKGFTADASNYASDLLLGSISGAGTVKTDNSYSLYKYTAIFARINYNYENRYVLNLSGRRDGSSRFGPESRFNNFGAVGGAWLFSNERFSKRKLAFLNLGKLRASYGVTGNDQIPNYAFLDTWNTGSLTYQQNTTLVPNSLFNPSLVWESNKKFEVALDLGFIRNKLLFSASYFRNLSGNQLINYALPIQTGFTSISKNFDALIENRGFEFLVQSKNITSGRLYWTSSFNVTFNRNKLIQFEGLATSSYASRYVINQPLSVKKLYQSLGVDPLTGVYLFTDVDNNMTYSLADRIGLKNTEPKFYGGLRNTLAIGSFEVDLFLEFRKQTGGNYLRDLRVPGYRYYNQPTIVLQRWQKAGDNTTIQRFTSATTTQAYKNTSALLLSDVAYSDASFVRCKNLSISYNLKGKWLSRAKIDRLRLYMLAQNLFTITGYVGADPENQSLNALPPLRTIAGGIQLTF